MQVERMPKRAEGMGEDIQRSAVLFTQHDLLTIICFSYIYLTTQLCYYY